MAKKVKYFVVLRDGAVLGWGNYSDSPNILVGVVGPGALFRSKCAAQEAIDDTVEYAAPRKYFWANRSLYLIQEVALGVPKNVARKS